MPEFDPTTVVIEGPKIRGYLLAVEHRVGGARARFFISRGFDPELPEEFEEALRNHVVDNGVGDPINTGFGTKWVSEGPMKCPDGESPQVRTIWILDFDGETPRLVSAYPIDSDQ